MKKHLKRMHPGDHSGHVIDLGPDLATPPLPTQIPSMPVKDEPYEMNEHQLVDTNKMQIVHENNHQFYQQVFRQKID